MKKSEQLYSYVNNYQHSTVGYVYEIIIPKLNGVCLSDPNAQCQSTKPALIWLICLEYIDISCMSSFGINHAPTIEEYIQCYGDSTKLCWMMIIIKAASSDERALAVHTRRGLFMQHLPLRKSFLYNSVACSCRYYLLYTEARRSPCNLHEQIMRGLHCVTLQTVKQRFVSISKAALPSGGESLSTQKWEHSNCSFVI